MAKKTKQKGKKIKKLFLQLNKNENTKYQLRKIKKFPPHGMHALYNLLPLRAVEDL